MITSDLVALIESGVSMIVGTRDAAMRPDCCRALGARVSPDGQTLTVLVPAATAGRSIANLLDNGRLAVTFSRILDHHTVQIKGNVEAIAPAPACDRETVERYRRAVAAELEVAGMPQHVVFRVQHWPSWAQQDQAQPAREPVRHDPNQRSRELSGVAGPAAVSA